MKRLKVTGFFLSLSMVFGACQPTSTPKEKPKNESSSVLRINIEDEPQSLDPRKARSLSSGTILRMLFEGLTRVNKEEQPELALAQSVTISEDMKTYTFTLRKSMWNNGQPVTADDFAYAWKKVLDPHFPSDYAYQLYVIKNAKAAKDGTCSLDEIGVRVLDLLTLQVELENPVSYFLELMAFPVFFPVNRLVDQSNPNWAQNALSYVCNGPFTMDKWNHNYLLQVKKNDLYWDAAAVKMSKIQMVMVPEDTGLKMFEKNELDWAGSPLSVLPIDTIHQLKKEGALKSKSLLGTSFFRTNTKRAPFHHPAIRKAFAIAIDRQAIVEHVLQGKQIPATGIVPISMRLQEDPFFEDGDSAKARELFEQAMQEEGWTRETFPSVTLTYPSTERGRIISQAIQQQWHEAFGINVKLEAIESKVYFARVSKQDFQLAFGSWAADFNDPISFLEVFKYKTASTNNTLWEDPEYSQLLDQSNLITNPQERREILRKCQKLIMDAMPIIPIFHYTMLYVQNDNVKDVVLSGLGTMDFKWARIEEGESR
jgi:oligopeptide transport system substrate-binding protein